MCAVQAQSAHTKGKNEPRSCRLIHDQNFFCNSISFYTLLPDKDGSCMECATVNPVMFSAKEQEGDPREVKDTVKD